MYTIHRETRQRFLADAVWRLIRHARTTSPQTDDLQGHKATMKLQCFVRHTVSVE